MTFHSLFSNIKEVLPTVDLAIFFMEAVFAKLLATMSTAKVVDVIGPLEGGHAFLKILEFSNFLWFYFILGC